MNIEILNKTINISVPSSFNKGNMLEEEEKDEQTNDIES